MDTSLSGGRIGNSSLNDIEEGLLALSDVLKRLTKTPKNMGMSSVGMLMVDIAGVRSSFSVTHWE